jgi:peptidoglycan/xylan/chitin deacetylase (PgdA/CDA1 family)
LTGSSGHLPERDWVGYGRHIPRARWPNDALVVVNIVVNYEEGGELALLDDGVNDSWGESPGVIAPDIRDLGTESDMEYGSRVGVWRLCRLFDAFGVDVTFSACGRALERNPAICAWLQERTHDVQGHGYRWYGPDAPSAGGHDREAERREIADCVNVVEKLVGQRIRGWNVRSLPTVHTRELLVEHGGFLYDSDAVNDELPYFTAVGTTRFLVVPYTKVHNDARYFIPPTYASPKHFFESLKLGLDYLVDEAEHGHGERMMSVGLHPRWSGHPNRAAAVRNFIEYALEKDGVAFMRRIDIAEHWLRVHA